MNLKKRIIGFLLLAGIILICIPLFFGHSVSTTELKLSAKIPTAPAKPQDLSIAIPPETSENPPAKPSSIFQDSSAPKPVINTPAPAAPVATPVQNQATPTKESSLPPTAVPIPSNPPAVATPATQTASSALPAKPAATETKTDAIVEDEPSDETDSAPEKATPDADTKTSTTKITKHVSTTTSPKTATSGTGWGIELGSFADKKNVDHLIQKLKSQGLTPRTKAVQSNHGSLTSVWVGPYADRATAAKMLTKLQSEFKLQGFLFKEGGKK